MATVFRRISNQFTVLNQSDHRFRCFRTVFSQKTSNCPDSVSHSQDHTFTTQRSAMTHFISYIELGLWTHAIL